jgi:hypothetical protein
MSEQQVTGDCPTVGLRSVETLEQWGAEMGGNGDHDEMAELRAEVARLRAEVARLTARLEDHLITCPGSEESGEAAPPPSA